MAIGTTLQQLAKGNLQLEEQPRGRLVAATFSILAIAGLGLLFTVVVVLPKVREEPEVIVEVIVPPVQAAPRMQKLNALKSFEKSFTMPAGGSLARMMRASSRPLEVPGGLLDHYELDDKPLGFGVGDLGDAAAAAGEGEGMDRNGEGAVSDGVQSGATFFGLGTRAKRIVFLLDYSEDAGSVRRMIESQMRDTIKALNPDVQFAVICYAAIPWRLGRDLIMRQEDGNYVVSYTGGRKTFYQQQGERFALVGLPTFRLAGQWSRSTPASSREIGGELANQQPMAGHDWYNAFTMAHNFDPKPDAIFFVIAGGAGVPGEFEKMAAYNRDQGNPAVLGILLKTARGAREMHALSQASGGQSRIIVDDRMRAVSVEKFLANPSNEMRFLGEFDQWLQWEKERETRGLK